MAPVFTLAERAVLARFAAAIGAGYAGKHDGLFVPGSSIGNMYGLILARHRAAPEVNERGMGAVGRLVAFVSKEAHYSYLKVPLACMQKCTRMRMRPTSNAARARHT